MIVYCITNLVNGKRYVGVDRHTNQRWASHKRRARKSGPNARQLIDRKLHEYGIENFSYEVLCECASIEDMKRKEQRHIKLFDTYVGNGHGYNLTLGGDGCVGFEMPKEKVHRGETHYQYGKRQSAESNRKRSLALKGTRLGHDNPAKRPDVRAKISRAAKKRIGKKNPNFRYDISRDMLNTYYIDQRHCLSDTAQHFGCSEATVVRKLKEYGISKRQVQRRVSADSTVI